MSSEPSLKPTDGSHHCTPEGPEVAAKDASSEPIPKPTDQAKSLSLQELVDAANSGDAAAIEALREVLEQHPEIWKKIGNLAAHVEATWIRLMAEGKPLTLESIRREADRMRLELLGGSPTPIEKLLVDQIIACWLQVKHAEMTAGSGREISVMQGRFKDQRVDRAQRRYLSAMKTLSQIRRLPLSALMPATRESSPLPTVGEAFEKPPATPAAPPAEPASAPDTTAFRIFPEREAV